MQRETTALHNGINSHIGQAGDWKPLSAMRGDQAGQAREAAIFVKGATRSEHGAEITNDDFAQPPLPAKTTGASNGNRDFRRAFLLAVVAREDFIHPRFFFREIWERVGNDLAQLGRERSRQRKQRRDQFGVTGGGGGDGIQRAIALFDRR